MDQELQKLIRELQHEKCPPAVMERVAERISREKSAARSLRPNFAWAVSIALVLGAVVFWQWQNHREAKRIAAAEQARANRALVVQQTGDAFGYIGQAMLRAAAHTENALSKQAVPPLRNGFEVVKNTMNKPI
jgi:uncharacterized protein HemX